MSMLADPLNLLFIAVAAVAGFKLWQVLGQRTGFQPLAPLTKIDTAPAPTDLVLKPEIRKPAWEGFAGEHEPLGQALEQISLRIPQFETAAFIAKARLAHEHILEAFAASDLATLKNLLAPEILPTFEAEVARRKSAGETAFFRFVGISEAKLQAGRVTGSTAMLDVRFVSQVFSAMRDKAGSILTGDEKQMRVIKELWTFESDLNSADKVWKLAETQDAA